MDSRMLDLIATVTGCCKPPRKPARGPLPGWSSARAVRLAPRVLRDGLYGRIARNRYRLFGRTDACMVPPPGLARRVLHDAPG